MTYVLRRRCTRGAVLVAATAVLATLVIAPAAQAAPIAAPGDTATAAPATAPPADPTSAVPEGSTATSEPTTPAVPTSGESGSTDPTQGPPLPQAAPGMSPEASGEPVETAPVEDGPVVEPGDTVVGELVQAWPDPTVEEHAHDDEHTDEPLSWIEPTDGDAVRVPTDSLPDVAVGSMLSVDVGAAISDEASTEQGFDPAVEVRSATVVVAASADPSTASAGSAPTNTVTAVLVLPAGATPDGMTIGPVVDTLNGPASAFWREQSSGTVRITATQGSAGWISSTQPCSSAVALWNDVAAQIGWTGGSGKHLMLYVPANAPGCSYGLGTVGSSIGTGGRSYVQAAALSVMAHELGHNFGLGHSSELQCSSMLESGSCQTRSYYDFYDVMGISWGQVGTLNSSQASRLGLLPSAQQVALTASSAVTTVTLVPVSASSGIRAVKLAAPDGSVYYLEYRQPSGQDAWLGDSRNAYRLDTGVVVRRATSGSDTSLLLDGTPSAPSGWSGDLQQALRVGTPVSVAGGAFSVTVQGQSASGATLRVGNTDSPIWRAYTAAGGAAGPLGVPLAAESCGLRDSGCYQRFAGGSYYWTAATGAHAVRGPVQDLYSAMGWETSWLGYPTSDTICGLRGGGCVSYFPNGSIFWSPFTGARVVNTVLMTRWQELGWEAGAVGYPLSNVGCGLTGGGCAAVFEGGSVYWSPATGSRFVNGATAGLWSAMGGPDSWLGYPTSDTICALQNGGCVTYFQRGSVFWSARTGARAINTVLMTRWQELGWEAGAVGYPLSNVGCGLTGGGCAAVFEGGSVYWSPATGAHFVGTDIRDRWAANGAESAWLGYPTGDRVCGLRDGGCGGDFQGGSIYSSPATGAHVVAGGMRSAWLAAGAQDAWGFPVTDTWCGLAGGGCEQEFQYVHVYWSPTNGPHVMDRTFRAAFAARGGESGDLGAPVGDQACGLEAGGCRAAFVHGWIAWSPTTGAWAVDGALASAWAAAGGTSGSLGYPTSGPRAVTDGLVQTFQGGTLREQGGSVTRS